MSWRDFTNNSDCIFPSCSAVSFNSWLSYSFANWIDGFWWECLITHHTSWDIINIKSIYYFGSDKKKKSQFSILSLDFHRIGCIWLKKCISVFVLCIALNTFLQTKLTLIWFFDFISDWFVCEVCFAVTNAKTKKRIWAFVAAICGLCFCHHHKFGTGNLFLLFGS